MWVLRDLSLLETIFITELQTSASILYLNGKTYVVWALHSNKKTEKKEDEKKSKTSKLGSLALMVLSWVIIHFTLEPLENLNLAQGPLVLPLRAPTTTCRNSSERSFELHLEFKVWVFMINRHDLTSYDQS